VEAASSLTHSLILIFFGYGLFQAGYRCHLVTPTTKDAYVEIVFKLSPERTAESSGGSWRIPLP
jgi:hypothetical protein